MILGALAWPVTSLRTGMPSITIIPQSQTARAGYYDVVNAFGPGAPGTLSVLTPSRIAGKDGCRARHTTRASRRPCPAAPPPGGR